MAFSSRPSRLVFLVATLCSAACAGLVQASPPPFGQWQELGTPAPRLNHMAFYDQTLDRMLVFGGHPNDAWSFQFGPQGGWAPFLSPPGGPGSYQGACGAWDSSRNRALFVYLNRNPNEVWALDFVPSPHWTHLATTATAFHRAQETVTYDALRDRLIVFGGWNADFGFGPTNDLWALPLGSGGTLAWQNITPAGTLPPARVDHAAVIDVNRDRLVIFGGSTGDNGQYQTFGDAWTLPLGTPSSWISLPGLSWPGHSQPTATFDAANNRMIVIGGAELGTPEAPFVAGGVFQLAFGDPNDPNATPQWTSLASGPGPDDRYGHTAVFRPAANEIDIFAGAHQWNDQRQNELWAYCLAPSLHWESRTPTQGPPPERIWQNAVFDPTQNRMILYGGWNAQYMCDIYCPVRYNYDVWDFDLTAGARWSEREVDQYYRSNYSAVFDPVRERMIAFGGQTWAYGSLPYLRNDVIALPTQGDEQWIPIQPTGTPPSARMGHTAIYDPVADRMIVFGGSTNIYGNTPTNETWQLTLADPPAWSLLSPAGTPPSARFGHMSIYDPKRDRMVVIGGGHDTQVWSLSLRPSLTWQVLPTSGSSPAAFGDELAAIYDPIGDRVLTFSGKSTVAVWSLDLSTTPSTWTAWTPSGLVPPAGQDYSAVYDPNGDRAIVFGFDALSGIANRTWALEFGRPVPALASLVSAEATGGRVRVTWLLPDGPSSRATVQRRSGVSDWENVGEVVADGSGLATFEDAGVQAGERYAYRLEISGTYAAEAWVTVPGAASLQIFGAQPNPSPRVALSFSLASEGPARLEMFDLRGRLVAQRRLDGFGVGTHVLSIPEADKLASGIYVVRLTQDSASAVQRITILH